MALVRWRAGVGIVQGVAVGVGVDGKEGSRHEGRGRSWSGLGNMSKDKYRERCGRNIRSRERGRNICGKGSRVRSRSRSG